jgi:hypothetical protein
MMLGCGLAKVDAIKAGPKNVQEFQGQKLLHYRCAKTFIAEQRLKKAATLMPEVHLTLAGSKALWAGPRAIRA